MQKAADAIKKDSSITKFNALIGRRRSGACDMRHGKYPFIIGFLVVPVALYVYFVVAAVRPGVPSVADQLARLSPRREYVGLDNFTTAARTTSVFWKAVRHHAVLLLVLPLVTIVIALFFAFLLNVGGGSAGGATAGRLGLEVLPGGVLLPAGAGRGHRRACIFARSTGPTSSGLINGLLMQLGARARSAVPGRPEPGALVASSAVLVWQAVGFYVVLFSAGMASIPTDIYEAARAGRRQPGQPVLPDHPAAALGHHPGRLGLPRHRRLRRVRPGAGACPWTAAAPTARRRCCGLEIYRNAFDYSQFGYASALGVVLFFLTITFAALTLRVTRRETIEY